MLRKSPSIGACHHRFTVAPAFAGSAQRGGHVPAAAWRFAESGQSIRPVAIPGSDSGASVAGGGDAAGTRRPTSGRGRDGRVACCVAVRRRRAGQSIRPAAIPGRATAPPGRGAPAGVGANAVSTLKSAPPSVCRRHGEGVAWRRSGADQSLPALRTRERSTGVTGRRIRPRECRERDVRVTECAAEDERVRPAITGSGARAARPRGPGVRANGTNHGERAGNAPPSAGRGTAGGVGGCAGVGRALANSAVGKRRRF